MQCCLLVLSFKDDKVVVPVASGAYLLKRCVPKTSEFPSSSFNDFAADFCNIQLTNRFIFCTYHLGIYNVELLVGMIALHLDATYATCDIWGEFASCFLELEALTRFPYEDDQMSTNREMDDDNSMQMRFSPNRIPKLFAKAQEIKMWRLRCRWWATRHFSKNACLLEKQAGDWQLLTFKAACASHLYDEKFEYAASVYNILEEENDTGRLSFLQMHFGRSIKLLGNLNRTA
ncbi:hypothetical protein ACLOJK_019073 [Asimina triloba]